MVVDLRATGAHPLGHLSLVSGNTATEALAWDAAHLAIDDCSRVSFARILDDEKACAARSSCLKPSSHHPRHAPRQMRQRLLHLIHQHEAKIPRRQARQRRVDRSELAPDLLDVLRAARALQAFA